MTISLRPIPLALIPPAAALLLTGGAFLAQPGFTVIPILGVVAMLPLTLGIGIPVAVVWLPKRLNRVSVWRARSRAALAMLLVWTVALLTAPVLFWGASWLFIFAGIPGPDLTVSLAVAVWLVCLPGWAITTVAGAIVTVLAVRDRGAAPADTL